MYNVYFTLYTNRSNTSNSVTYAYAQLPEITMYAIKVGVMFL